MTIAKEITEDITQNERKGKLIFIELYITNLKQSNSPRQHMVKQMHHKQMTLDSMIRMYAINIRLMVMCTCGGSEIV